LTISRANALASASVLKARVARAYWRVRPAEGRIAIREKGNVPSIELFEDFHLIALTSRFAF
jgi:hypothetical protein